MMDRWMWYICFAFDIFQTFPLPVTQIAIRCWWTFWHTYGEHKFKLKHIYVTPEIDKKMRKVVRCCALTGLQSAPSTPLTSSLKSSWCHLFFRKESHHYKFLLLKIHCARIGNHRTIGSPSFLTLSNSMLFQMESDTIWYVGVVISNEFYFQSFLNRWRQISCFICAQALEWRRPHFLSFTYKWK